jgi:hypothetical protein
VVVDVVVVDVVVVVFGNAVVAATAALWAEQLLAASQACTA